MKIEKAKTKWCPFTRFHKGMDNDVYCNRPVGKVDNNSSLCIADACMCWKWNDAGVNYLNPKEGHCGLVK
jgi:hypothetical protein